MPRLSAVLLLASVALAHGDHGGESDEGLSYAESHMHNEHHIDSFDPPAFFKLHDLNSDGYWNADEIAALYGLRHHSVLDPHRASNVPDGLEDKVVAEVLGKLDTDGDGRVSLAEFEVAGPASLPNFKDEFKDLGHHYDEESEYFLHHEELYHSTPETQTEEAYNHPEDIEHFRHHHKLESEEDARQRIFQGLAPDADLDEDHEVVDPLDVHEHAEGEGVGGDGFTGDEEVPLLTGVDGEEAAAEEAGEESGEAHEGETGETEEQHENAAESTPDDAAAPAADDAEHITVAHDDPGFRAARAAARTPPRRISPEGGKNRRGHTAEHRLKPDAPYKFKMRAGIRGDEF